MGWRAEVEDQYTVTCQRCKQEWINPEKRNLSKNTKYRCYTLVTD